MAKKDESMEKLASAMEKLADRLEKFQDPVLWQRVLSDAVQAMPTLGAVVAPLQISTPTELPPGRIESVAINLSDEERDRLATQVHEAVKPQLQEFSEFVRQGLQEMPAHRLKELAEKIEQGEKPQIRRRHGCIFICAGESEVYLGL